MISQGMVIVQLSPMSWLMSSRENKLDVLFANAGVMASCVLPSISSAFDLLKPQC